MRLLPSIILCALGFAAGLEIWQALNAGYPQRWGELQRPPGTAVELIGTGVQPLLVRTADGTRYDFVQGDGWVPAEAPREMQGPSDVEPCAAVFLRFGLPNVSPNALKQCLHITAYYADGYIEYGVALDSAGGVWKWERARTPADLPGYLLAMVCCPASGLLLGVLIAYVWNAMSAVQAVSQCSVISDQSSVTEH